MMAGPAFITLVVALPCLGAEIAAAAPTQLLNKTVVISWTRDLVEKRDDGKIIYVHRTDTRQIYVSTNGRLFIRSTAQANGRQQTRDVEPDDNSTPEGPRDGHFEGGQLILTRARYSGASRVTIDFDSRFTSCTMKFIIAKENGASVRWRGITGATLQVMSSTVTSSSCEIRDGNLFAGQ
jgi:hypothetical protein